MIERLQRIETWVYRTAWLLAIPLLATVQFNIVSLVFMCVILALAFVGTILCTTIDSLNGLMVQR
jgi:hypothetical protein